MTESTMHIFFMKTVHVFLLKLVYMFMFITDFAADFIMSFMIFTVKLADDFMLIFTSICETEFIN